MLNTWPKETNANDRGWAEEPIPQDVLKPDQPNPPWERRYVSTHMSALMCCLSFAPPHNDSRSQGQSCPVAIVWQAHTQRKTRPKACFSVIPSFHTQLKLNGASVLG